MVKLTRRKNYSLSLRFGVLILLSVAVLILNHNQKYLQQARNTIAVAVTPIQYLVNFPTKIIELVQGSFSSHQLLQSQNADLQAQVMLLKGQLQKLVSLEEENNQLRALLQTSPQTNQRVLVARLLAVDPDPFVQQVVLNKGSNQDTYVGQAVLDATGVFGQVIQTGPHISRVLLITDTRSAVPIQDSRSGVRGIVTGQGNSNTLALENMPVTSDIKVGDLLVTSGLGDLYPMGYPVGRVTSLIKNPGQEFSTIVVSPTAHLYSSRLVLLIWPEAEVSAHETTTTH